MGLYKYHTSNKPHSMALQFFAMSSGLFASFHSNVSAVQPFLLKGINWFGFETETFSPHGLWSQSMDYLLDFLHKNKFNALRVPFSVEFVEKMDVQPPIGIDVYKNPDMHKKTSGQVLDILVQKAKRYGILIMPDMHRMEARGSIPPLWYDDKYPEKRILRAWKTLVSRYKYEPFVFAVDLKNEPHGMARWGGSIPAVNWPAAAQRIANELHRINPKLLIFVEGIAQLQDGFGTWWGGALDGVAKYPIKLKVPNKLVYSPHVYGPDVFGMTYFMSPNFPNNMPGIWTKQWEYVSGKKLGALVIGEWGGWNKAGTKDRTWHLAMSKFLQQKKLGCSTFYWCLNPNGGDTGGLLQDDWKTPVQSKLKLLHNTCPEPTKVPIPSKLAPLPQPQDMNISFPLLTPCDEMLTSEVALCNKEIKSFVANMGLLIPRASPAWPFGRL